MLRRNQLICRKPDLGKSNIPVMQLVFIICPNGLGHFERSNALINSLIESDSGVHVDVYCQRWQFEVIYGKVISPPHVTWHFDKMEPGVTWSTNPNVYNDKRLLTWVNRLSDEPAILNSDLVISDNLTGILEIRPDTVLMGSFLWSDIFEYAYADNSDVKAFVDWERKLLRDNQPFMLCIQDIVMPSILKQTQAVRLPWPCRKNNNFKQKNTLRDNKVGLLIGKTKSLKLWAKNTIPYLLDLINVKLSLPDDLLKFVPKGKEQMVERFGFTRRDYASCNAIICRPGASTLTRCIETNTPIIAVYEKDNIEMSHNGSVIAKLHWGINIGENSKVEHLSSAIEKILSNKKNSFYLNNLRNNRCDGLQVAINWISNRLINN